MAEWDPSQYLRFAGERLRPAIDLLAQVPLTAPARVVDLGCGTGNVAALLHARYAGAALLGVDGSAPMLEKARAAVPAARFEEADIAAWQPAEPPDLIYSNAALHWVGGHDRLFTRLLACLAPGGVLAVQMPAMHNAPLRALQPIVAASGPWAERLRGVGSARSILEPGEYWDMLRPHAASLEIWETTYLHALHGDDAVGEWASGSSLLPYLDALDPADRPAFRRAYAEATAPHYPRRADGTTLLPFRRLFMVARTAM